MSGKNLLQKYVSYCAESKRLEQTLIAREG